MKAPKSESKGFDKHPEGPCRLVLTRLIDKGTVWKEKKNDYVRSLFMLFESDKLITSGDYAGKPLSVIQSYTYSMFQNSKLCKFVEQMRGKQFASQQEADGFDLSSLIGTSIFANITHNGDFTNITSAMPLPQGMEALVPVGDVVIFDMNGPFPESAFAKLSDKMKEQIMRSKEYVAWEKGGKKTVRTESVQASQPPFSDDIPFLQHERGSIV